MMRVLCSLHLARPGLPGCRDVPVVDPGGGEELLHCVDVAAEVGQVLRLGAGGNEPTQLPNLQYTIHTDCLLLSTKFLTSNPNGDLGLKASCTRGIGKLC